MTLLKIGTSLGLHNLIKSRLNAQKIVAGVSHLISSAGGRENISFLPTAKK